MEKQKTGTEAYSSMRDGERNNQPILTTYRKLRIKNLRLSKHLALSFSVKSLNDVAGRDRYVPSTLVLVRFPRIGSTMKNGKW